MQRIVKTYSLQHGSLPIHSVLLPGLPQRLPHSKRIRNVADGVGNGIERDKHPQHVEEDEVDPEVHEVAAVEVDVAGEPLGAKGHEACIASIYQPICPVVLFLCFDIL